MAPFDDRFLKDPPAHVRSYFDKKSFSKSELIE